VRKRMTRRIRVVRMNSRINGEMISTIGGLEGGRVRVSSSYPDMIG